MKPRNDYIRCTKCDEQLLCPHYHPNGYCGTLNGINSHTWYGDEPKRPDRRRKEYRSK